MTSTFMHGFHRDYYMDFPLSRLSARDSNIGPKACPRSDIGRGLIDWVITKNPCYDVNHIDSTLIKTYRNN